MTLREFRILHSTLVEHYQYIELHLEGIYAAVSGKNFWDGIQDVENDGLSRIVRDIQYAQRQTGILAFDTEQIRQLQELFRRRNWWCHNCYTEMTFDRRTGGPKTFESIRLLQKDLQEAESWRAMLYEKKLQLLAENADTLLDG